MDAKDIKLAMIVMISRGAYINAYKNATSMNIISIRRVMIANSVLTRDMVGAIIFATNVVHKNDSPCNVFITNNHFD